MILLIERTEAMVPLTSLRVDRQFGGINSQKGVHAE